MEFNEKLQELRKEKGMSQEALAYELGVSRQAVSKWETAQGYPEMDKLIQMRQDHHHDRCRCRWQPHRYADERVADLVAVLIIDGAVGRGTQALGRVAHFDVWNATFFHFRQNREIRNATTRNPI